MPAPAKRPSPPARMVQLLTEAKRAILQEQGFVTTQDFEREWAAAWAQMVAERAWPHATNLRRAWRAAMLATRSEARAAFVGRPTAFAFATQRLTDAAAGMFVVITPAQIPKTLLAAIALVELVPDEEADDFPASRADGLDELDREPIAHLSAA